MPEGFMSTGNKITYFFFAVFFFEAFFFVQQQLFI